MRKKYSEKIILQNPTVKEKRIFEKIYKIFNSLIFLTHFDRARILYINIDMSKKRFGIIIYYVKN
jgi:hypothetical protein